MRRPNLVLRILPVFTRSYAAFREIRRNAAISSTVTISGRSSNRGGVEVAPGRKSESPFENLALGFIT